MCGHSSSEALRKLGILTIGDLAHCAPSILSSHLKSHGITLWNYANGIDHNIVNPTPNKVKGIGNSTTLLKDATTLVEIFPILLQLAESVGSRLRSANEKAMMISTEIKYASFQSVSHQTTLSTPTSSSTKIYEISCKLFEDLWNGEPVRLVGIRTSKLISHNEPVQLSLFDQEQTRKQDQLDQALDSLRHKFGDDIIKRGSLVRSPLLKDNDFD